MADVTICVLSDSTEVCIGSECPLFGKTCLPEDLGESSKDSVTVEKAT